MAEHPRLQITMAEALRLPEYSASAPTGVTIGKRWRRYDGSFDRDFIRRGGKPQWFICEYAESERGPDWAATIMYRAVIRVPAVLG